MNDSAVAKYLEMEERILSEYAAKSSSSHITKRQHEENSKHTTTEGRLCFQKDRDRIVHSRAFRRLMHKSQVFNANFGDHYRNRLTHTLEVSQIGRSIGKRLQLNDELIEAIALGHDLGHTPFGHVGERTLHLIISGKYGQTEEGFNKSRYGGFKHNYQSLQIVDNIEKRTTLHNGLNLTLAVRDGIIKHTSSKIRIPKEIADRNFKNTNKEDVDYSTLDLTNIDLEIPPVTLEGQVVKIADEIAQCTHDLEDGIRAGVIKKGDLSANELVKVICGLYNTDIQEMNEVVDIRNTIIKYLVGYLIRDVCAESGKELKKITNIPKFTNDGDIYNKMYIKFSDGVSDKHKDLSSFITNAVIASQHVTKSDVKAEFIIKNLFKAYYYSPQQLPDYILNRYFNRKGRSYTRLTIEDNKKSIIQDGEFVRLICDHIGSMTDQFASREYKKLFEPEFY